MAFDKSDPTSPYYQPDTTDWDNLLAPANTMEPDLSPSQQAGASDPEIFYPLQHYTEQAISTNTPVSVSHDLADSQTHIAAAAKVNDKFFPGHQSQNNFSSLDYTAFPVQKKKSKFFVNQDHTNSFDDAELADVPMSQSGSGYTASGGIGSFDEIPSVYKAESSTVAAQQFKDNMKQQPNSNANTDKKQQLIITGFPATIKQALTIYKKGGSDFPISLQTIDDMTDMVMFEFTDNFHDDYIVTNIIKNLPEIKNQVKQQLYPGYDSSKPTPIKTRTITVTDVENSLTSVLQSYIPSTEVNDFSRTSYSQYQERLKTSGQIAEEQRKKNLYAKKYETIFRNFDKLFSDISENYPGNIKNPKFNAEKSTYLINQGLKILNQNSSRTPAENSDDFYQYYYSLQNGYYDYSLDIDDMISYLNKNLRHDPNQIYNIKLALIHTALNSNKELERQRKLNPYTTKSEKIFKLNTYYSQADTSDLKTALPGIFEAGYKKGMKDQDILASVHLTAGRLNNVYEHNKDLGIAIANRVYSQTEGYNLLDGLEIYALGALSLLSNDCANLQQDIIKASSIANKIKGDNFGEFIKNNIVDIIGIAACFIPGAGFTGTVRNVIETVINVSGHAANINIYLDRCDAIMNDPQYKDNPKDQFLALCGATADIISVTGFNETMRLASNAAKTGNYAADTMNGVATTFDTSIIDQDYKNRNN